MPEKLVTIHKLWRYRKINDLYVKIGESMRPPERERK